eukprot:TRINITY_DN15072_c0_g1_i1.p1 TRINITY_DN15072_c0_g1~~TRINITY_DN15072_c0_g1_i1.p1  ORF type:complete len:305 (-),score=69.52 TRINITY_DN15072_c0_g1_i1:62-976(-)
MMKQIEKRKFSKIRKNSLQLFNHFHQKQHHFTKMAVEFSQVVKDFEQFKSSVESNANPEQSKQLLEKLKLPIARLSFPSSKPSPEEQQKQWLVARETYEYAALLSIKLRDVDSFERYFSQLKTFYFDYAKNLPPSQKQFSILGLQLLYCLSKDRLDEFHTLLELIPFEQHSNVFVKHPIQLEQYMMEGAFNKVLAEKNAIPAESYAFFMDQLMHTVRGAIAECCMSAYDYLYSSDAQKLLGLNSQQELKSYSQERKWRFGNHDGKEAVFFKSEEESNKEQKTEIPSFKLIKQTLQYARELERIV